MCTSRGSDPAGAPMNWSGPLAMITAAWVSASEIRCTVPALPMTMRLRAKVIAYHIPMLLALFASNIPQHETGNYSGLCLISELSRLQRRKPVPLSGTALVACCGLRQLTTHLKVSGLLPKKGSEPHPNPGSLLPCSTGHAARQRGAASEDRLLQHLHRGTLIHEPETLLGPKSERSWKLLVLVLLEEASDDLSRGQMTTNRTLMAVLAAKSSTGYQTQAGAAFVLLIAGTCIQHHLSEGLWYVSSLI